MRIKPIGLSLLLIIGATNAFADPGGNGRSTREAVRAYQFQSVAMERDNSRGQQAGQQVPEQRRGREYGVPDSSGYGAQGEHQSNSSSESARKQGRLSPEERRALRRQIDEVGHDIYAPQR